jgi:membrane protein implicated in regulation of membrane protease activity
VTWNLLQAVDDVGDVVAAAVVVSIFVCTALVPRTDSHTDEMPLITTTTTTTTCIDITVAVILQLGRGGGVVQVEGQLKHTVANQKLDLSDTV